MMIKITVDNQEIEAEEGATVLKACLDNDIYVPNLCFLESMTDPPASCRMCLVEIEGEKGPVASCTITVKQGMVIRTETAPVRRLQRSALRLLLSVHEVECAACPANKKCELQRLAKFLQGHRHGTHSLTMRSCRSQCCFSTIRSSQRMASISSA